jgi:hypothetical protein
MRCRWHEIRFFPLRAPAAPFVHPRAASSDRSGNLRALVIFSTYWETSDSCPCADLGQTLDLLPASTTALLTLVASVAAGIPTSVTMPISTSCGQMLRIVSACRVTRNHRRPAFPGKGFASASPAPEQCSISRLAESLRGSASPWAWQSIEVSCGKRRLVLTCRALTIFFETRLVPGHLQPVAGQGSDVLSPWCTIIDIGAHHSVVSFCRTGPRSVRAWRVTEPTTKPPCEMGIVAKAAGTGDFAERLTCSE